MTPGIEFFGTGLAVFYLHNQFLAGTMCHLGFGEELVGILDMFATSRVEDLLFDMGVDGQGRTNLGCKVRLFGLATASSLVLPILIGVGSERRCQNNNYSHS